MFELYSQANKLWNITIRCLAEGSILAKCSFTKFLFTWRMDCLFSGFTLIISWLSSRSSAAGHCSSATPSSLYVRSTFDLLDEHVIFEISVPTTSLFGCFCDPPLVLAALLFRFFLRTGAIAPNRRQISRLGVINEWKTGRYSPDRGKAITISRQRRRKIQYTWTTVWGNRNLTSFSSCSSVPQEKVKSWKLTSTRQHAPLWSSR